MDIDLAAEIEVPTTRAAGRKRKSASDVKAKSKPANTRSKAKRSKKGAKKAPETAIIDDAEPNLPTEALPALRRH